MQSKNPIFSRSEGFNGKPVTSSDDQNIIINGGATGPGGFGVPTLEGRMTIETVVEKTAITLGLVVTAAAVTWFMIGDIYATPGAIGKAWMLAMGGAIIGLILSLVVSFRKKISPAMVMAYAVVEGVFVGAFSKIIASYIGDASIVFQAVMATMIAFAATLAAYKFFNIQVTPKFRRMVTIAVFAFFAVTLVNFILSFTPLVNEGGLRSFSTLGLVVSLFAVGLAVFCLILDFDYIERGIAMGLPEQESWRGAFGLTVTLVWMYIEILRILAILRGN